MDYPLLFSGSFVLVKIALLGHYVYHVHIILDVLKIFGLLRMVDCCAIVPGGAYEPKNYEHQVGGHVGLSSPDAFHVCKPASDRELLFYRCLPPPLAPFVPTFCGFAEGSYGRFEAGPAACGNCCKRSRSRPRVQQLAAHTRCVQQQPLQPEQRSSPVMMQRIRKARNLIVLSNLAARFAQPCVLDVKLGTRQHGDDAPDEKRRMHEKRCARSTSARLGVRLCGMRIYDPTTNAYETVDKYAGREMNPEALEMSIGRFLSDSSHDVRRGLCRQILSKVEKLIEALETCDGLRLFGSSLLIVYDGASTSDGMNEECPVQVCLVDFANATHPIFDDSCPRYEGPDGGCLRGLHTLSEFLCRLLESKSELKPSATFDKLP